MSMRQGHGICHLERVLCYKGGQGQNQSGPEKGQVTVLFSEEGQDLGDICYQTVLYKQGLSRGTLELQLSVPAGVWDIEVWPGGLLSIFGQTFLALSSSFC